MTAWKYWGLKECKDRLEAALEARGSWKIAVIRAMRDAFRDGEELGYQRGYEAALLNLRAHIDGELK